MGCGRGRAAGDLALGDAGIARRRLQRRSGQPLDTGLGRDAGAWPGVRCLFRVRGPLDGAAGRRRAAGPDPRPFERDRGRGGHARRLLRSGGARRRDAGPAGAESRLRADPAAGVAGDRHGRLAIHDLRGRRVRAWTLAAGDYLVSWDGRDEQGRRLPSGVYIVRLEHGGSVMTRKATLKR
ncbi:MAG: hypothetical protein IPM94_05285 [bacterium]|nr:hypothetical protein [bacterium]